MNIVLIRGALLPQPDKRMKILINYVTYIVHSTCSTAVYNVRCITKLTC